MTAATDCWLWRLRLEDVPIDLIDGISIQPEKRTADENLDQLESAVRESHLLVPPILIKKRTRYECPDGNQRSWTAYDRLGKKVIQCLVIDSERELTVREREAIFALLQVLSPLDPIERASAWARSVDPDNFLELLAIRSKAFAAQIRGCEEIWGTTRARRMFLAEKRSPVVAEHVRWIERVLDEHALCAIPPRQIGEWMYRHEMFKVVEDLRRCKQEPETISDLADCIYDDHPYIITERR